MSEVIQTARALLDELNANAAAGLITRQALILMGCLQRALSKVEARGNLRLAALPKCLGAATRRKEHGRRDHPPLCGRARRQPVEGNRMTKLTPRQELEAVLDTERAGAVLDHRKAMRKPLTAYAARLLAKQLARCPDANEAADHMILQGWQGFRAEWVEPRGANVVRLTKPLSASQESQRALDDILGPRKDRTPAADSFAGRTIEAGFTRRSG